MLGKRYWKKTLEIASDLDLDEAIFLMSQSYLPCTNPNKSKSKNKGV